MATVNEHGPVLGYRRLCEGLGLPRSTYYRTRRGRHSPIPRPTPERALTAAERQQVLEVLHSERFVDLSPWQVYARLLEEEQYLCSVRTMYRILSASAEVRERRNQLKHPKRKAPELLSTCPNQVWSWDITKLLGPEKWTYFYLYVVMDIFSRYVVGWLIAERENSEHAKRLIRECCRRECVEPDTLTLHSDRGSPMTSKTTGQLLADLGVTKSHSRPHVSNDNPFSEAQFKTLKYRPEFPDRFGCLLDAQIYCRSFFPWYNQEHRHSSLGYLTPAQVHQGRSEEICMQRDRVLRQAYQLHPERFVLGTPSARRPAQEVWIGKKPERPAQTEAGISPPKKGAPAGGLPVLVPVSSGAGQEVARTH